MIKKYYTLSVFFAMLACQTAVAQVRHANGLRGYAAEAEAAMVEQVQRTETWGDWYGAVITKPMPTKVTYYYYDNANRLVASLLVSNIAGDSETTVEVEQEGDQIPEDFKFYEYDAQGNLLSVRQRKYGLYDGLYRDWAATTTLVEQNAYNEQNELVHQIDQSGGCSGFTWADGNMVEKNDTTGYGNWTKTTVYADFLAGVKNAPQTDYQVDRYGQKYVGTYTYDAQGRLLTYVTTKVKEAEIDDNHHMSGVVLEENPYQRVVYTYEDGVLTSQETSYWNATAADFVPSSKVAYSVDADGGQREAQYTYSTSSQDWKIMGSPQVHYQQQYLAGCAPSSLTATVDATKPGVINLTATAPEAVTGMEAWHVYRNGVMVGEATLDAGQITYSDADVKNGDYLYYIQRGSADSPEGYNVSNLAAVTQAVSLNAPVDAHIAGRTTETANGRTNYVVTLAWKAPESIEGMPLLGYNVYADIKYYVTNPQPLNGAELIQGTTYDFKWDTEDDKCHILYVEAVYGVGRVKSEPVAVKLDAEPVRLLTTSGVLGEMLEGGLTPDNVPSKLTTYFYDDHNRLVRTTLAGRLAGDVDNTPDVVEKEGDYMITEYNYFNYDENGNLVEELKSKYGINQGFNFTWTQPDTLVTYDYDTLNRLVAKHDLQGGREYTYSYEGSSRNVVREVVTVASTGKVNSSFDYSDFVPGFDNLPRRVVKDGQYTSSQRVIENEYDGAGRKVMAYTYKFGEVQRDADNRIISVQKGDAEYKETWTYDEEGRLAQYEKQKWSTKTNDWQSSSRVEHEFTEYGELVTTYTFTSAPEGGVWTHGLPVLNTYAEYYENTAPTAFHVTKDENKLNTVNITAVAPYDKWESPSFEVYRNGQLIGEAKAVGSSLTFIDETVQNGAWDYYLRANTKTSNVCTSITTPITVEFDTYLPNATNIHATGARKDAEYYYMSLAWDAPESDIPVLGYNVYHDIKSYTKNPSPDNGANYFPAQAYDYMWSTEASGSRTYYVETVYNIGRTRSEGVVIDAEEVITAIETLPVAGAAVPTLTLQGRTLHVSEPYATLQLVGTSGAVEGVYRAQQRISLNHLPQGVYVVTLTTAEGVRTHGKIVVK